MTAPTAPRELLPCPFCGGEARLWPVIMPFDADCDAITVQCTKCDVIGADVLVDQDVHGQSDLPDLEAEAIAAWNTRTAAREVEVLREALGEAEKHFGPFADITINGLHDPEDVRVIALIRAALARQDGGEANA